MDGANIIVKVNSGDEATPQWDAVGMQSGVNLDRTTKMLPRNHKGSKWAEYDAGKLGWQEKLDGFYVPSQAEFTLLRTAWRNQDKVQVAIEYPESSPGAGDAPDPEFGYAWVATMTESFPDDDQSTISVTLQGTGELTEDTLPTGA